MRAAPFPMLASSTRTREHHTTIGLRGHTRSGVDLGQDCKTRSRVRSRPVNLRGTARMLAHLRAGRRCTRSFVTVADGPLPLPCCAPWTLVYAPGRRACVCGEFELDTRANGARIAQPLLVDVAWWSGMLV
eukprot:ctg_177.g74